jgi:folate-binding protein YgfZ
MSDFQPSVRTRAGAASCVLRLEGKDVLPLLHNISTRSLLDLAPGEARATLFCDFRGRLLHRAAVARMQDGGVWLVRPDAPGDDLAAHLDRHVFREDVRIADESAAWDVTARHDGTLPAGSVTERAGGFRLAIGDACVFELSAHAGEHAGEALDETERVRLGWPRHDHEIRDEFNAFEVNLGADVSLDKGCFTGQEALMRLITYRSVRRRLVSLAGRGDAAASADVRDATGEKIGRLTSVVREPDARDGAWRGLAVVRLESAIEGRAARIDAATDVSVTRVFPFASPLGRPFQL